MWRRNAIVLVSAALVVVALVALAHATEHLYSSVGSNQRLSAVLLTFACIAIASFVTLRGGFWTRTGLVVLLPILLSVVAEAFNRDAAYPGVNLVLGALVAATSFLACVFIGGPIFLWRQHRHGA